MSGEEDASLEIKRAHFFVEGRVQGVGFRHFVRTNARRYGLVGWVRNLWDGRVEAEAEGPQEDVERLIEACRKGPGTAYVTDVEVDWKPAAHDRHDFDVEF